MQPNFEPQFWSIVEVMTSEKSNQKKQNLPLF